MLNSLMQGTKLTLKKQPRAENFGMDNFGSIVEILCDNLQKGLNCRLSGKIWHPQSLYVPDYMEEFLNNLHLPAEISSAIKYVSTIGDIDDSSGSVSSDYGSVSPRSTSEHNHTSPGDISPAAGESTNEKSYTALHHPASSFHLSFGNDHLPNSASTFINGPKFSMTAEDNSIIIDNSRRKRPEHLTNSRQSPAIFNPNLKQSARSAKHRKIKSNSGSFNRQQGLQRSMRLKHQRFVEDNLFTKCTSSCLYDILDKNVLSGAILHNRSTKFQRFPLHNTTKKLFSSKLPMLPLLQDLHSSSCETDICARVNEQCSRMNKLLRSKMVDPPLLQDDYFVAESRRNISVQCSLLGSKNDVVKLSQQSADELGSVEKGITVAGSCSKCGGREVLLDTSSDLSPDLSKTKNNGDADSFSTQLGMNAKSRKLNDSESEVGIEPGRSVLAKLDDDTGHTSVDSEVSPGEFPCGGAVTSERQVGIFDCSSPSPDDSVVIQKDSTLESPAADVKTVTLSAQTAHSNEPEVDSEQWAEFSEENRTGHGDCANDINMADICGVSVSNTPLNTASVRIEGYLPSKVIACEHGPAVDIESDIIGEKSTGCWRNSEIKSGVAILCNTSSVQTHGETASGSANRSVASLKVLNLKNADFETVESEKEVKTKVKEAIEKSSDRSEVPSISSTIGSEDQISRSDSSLDKFTSNSVFVPAESDNSEFPIGTCVSSASPCYADSPVANNNVEVQETNRRLADSDSDVSNMKNNDSPSEDMVSECNNREESVHTHNQSQISDFVFPLQSVKNVRFLDSVDIVTISSNEASEASCESSGPYSPDVIHSQFLHGVYRSQLDTVWNMLHSPGHDAE